MGSVKNAYTDMIKRIASRTSLYDYQVREVMKCFVQETITDLAHGKSVHLMSLGKFWIKKIASRPGWNPKKKAKVMFPERFLPRFEYGGRAYDFIKTEANSNCKRQINRSESKTVPGR